MTEILQQLVNETNLNSYLSEHLPGYAEDKTSLELERVSAGHSNETFILRKGSQQWVLRRPPLGPLLPTAHDVIREYRVLSGLINTAVPVPRPRLACEDTTIIGAPFYLMDKVEGVVIRNSIPSQFDTHDGHYQLGYALVENLVKLHAVDWEKAGLANLGKPAGYLERQLRRWSDQLERAKTRPLPELDAVTQWLQSHLPISPAATIVHGDYRIDNVMYSHTEPIKIVATLDWEMATLGDPLADLGYLLAFWRQADDEPLMITEELSNVTTQAGFVNRQEIAEIYAELSGRRLAPGTMAFYTALAVWKLAILLEGSYNRHLAGTTDDPYFKLLGEGVPMLGRRALAICNQ
jgi:aminoglycoside phosphotransferase (APT) family kinase protein